MERKIITERVKAGIERKKSVSKRRGQAGIAHAAQAIVLVVHSPFRGSVTVCLRLSCARRPVCQRSPVTGPVSGARGSKSIATRTRT